MFKKRTVLKPYALALAVVLVTVGTLLIFFVPWIYDFTMNAVLSLSTKPTFALWRKNPLPLYLEFYVFNWTNSEDLYTPGVKPRFEEIGPFVFEETKEKVNISWNINDTVTFRHLRHWYFREEMSISNLSSEIVTINAVALTAAHIIRDWSYVMKKGFDLSIKAISTKIHKRATVGEILFEGYDDPIINIGKAMPHMGIQIPDYDKFGWFYTRNGSYTYDGTFNMESNGPHFGNTREWNYNSSLPYYEGRCNNVNGSAGEFYSPNLKRDKIGFFSIDICRYVPLDYERDENIDGTNGYRYVLGDSFLDNGTKVPENECFCGKYCSPYGALNISTCRYGAPGFVSLPHFYSADPSYGNMVEGLNPVKERHQMFMVLEPNTGIPLHVEARLQLNLLVHPIKSIGIFENLPTFYFPVIWFEQKARIPTLLHILLKIQLNLSLILRCVAAVMLVGGIPWLVYLLRCPSKQTPCWLNCKPKSAIYDIPINDTKECSSPLMKPKENIVICER